MPIETGAGGVPLLEREQELAMLERLIDEVSRGEGRIAAIEGAPGIGKTALVQSACTLARNRGMHVLAARGLELERDFAYGVARQLFEPRLRGANDDERRSLLDGRAA